MPLGDDIYSGAAEYGRFNALIGVIFGTIIGIILIVIGTIMLVKHEEPLQQIMGTIKNSDNQCKNLVDKNNDNDPFIQCYVEVSYIINGKTYNITGFTNDKKTYKKDDKIPIYYKPSSPEKGQLTTELSGHIIGLILLVFGLFTAGGSWLWYYVTKKYQFAAAAGGVAGAYDLIKNV
jgi:uncharacterized protein YxeA